MQAIRFFSRLKTFAFLLALACPAALPALAAPAAPAQQDQAAAPPALQAWRDWARWRQEFRQCPLIAHASGATADDFLCAWPGVLTLDAGARGASFSQHWQVSAPGWVPLPGDSRHWPQEVTVNGSPQPVLAQGEAPCLWLAAGEYAVRGRLIWAERPQQLTIAPISGLIALSVDGKPVQPVQRDGDQLTLGRSSAPASQADSLQLQVYRKLADGIPAELTTQIQLQVSGKAREIEIAPVLPEHFAPTALQAPWPARLDAQGRLLVQAQPGQATLELTARADAPLAGLQARLPQTLAQEVWSYQDAPAIRVTAIAAGQGALAVDPRQAGVPRPWQALPAFAMNAGGQLRIEERSRGLAAGQTNRLTLARELWLDFSGGGYFARDAIRGQMQQGWRLDVAAPYRLQRADAGGQALLVTGEPGGDHGGSGASQNAGQHAAALTGVEWRSPQVGLDASLRIASGPGAALPVTGWRQSFDEVDAMLHLPYGYKLLAAPGADAATGSWADRWTILDIFLAAFIALLAWRLLGVGGGLAAAAYLLLGLQERGAPLWTLAAALALALLARALPAGRLGQALRVTQMAALAVFCLTAIAFAPGQLRAALYPQLERPDNEGFSSLPVAPAPMPASVLMAPPPPPGQAYEYEDAKARAPASAAPVLAGVAPNRRQEELERRKAETSKLAKAADAAGLSAPPPRYAQSSVVQTGAGEPVWNIGQHYRLHWTGPILAEQTVRLIISPPWLTRLARLLLVALLGLTCWRVARRAWPGGPQPAARQPRPAMPAASAAAALAAAALALSLALPAAPALAQDAAAFPPQPLLQTLGERLNRAPDCAPGCASIARADIRIQGSQLTVRLQAHAGASVALPLPAAADNATLRQARVDGQPIDSVRGDKDQTEGEMAYLLPLSRGVHLVELDYAVAGGDASLRFPLPPMRVLFEGRGWQAEGIDEERLINETLRLTRAASPAAAAAAADGGEQPAPQEAGAQQFPPYARVTRTLRFDLDWSASAAVTRLSPREGGITLAVPLLPGEHVTTPDVKVQDGQATVSLAQSEQETGWQSRLDKTKSLLLTAPALADRAEIWRVEVGPSWHVQYSGVPVTLATNAGGETVFEFHPLPGETLTLAPALPPAAEGATRAIDRVSLTHAIGMRASEHTLGFTLRASQGGEHVITLPEGMETLSAQRNGQELNLRPHGGKLTLPVSPGEQTYAITLRQTGEPGARLRMPAFDLGLPAANIDIEASLPEQRWLLASLGPRVGPVVLYWGELAVALALAFLLALLLTRRGWTTVRFHQWFLLVLGFSTFSWMALALIALWLIALDWRQRAGPLPAWPPLVFNGMQITLAVLSAAALVVLIAVIPVGLLALPNMGVAGHGSHGNHLNWFADQSGPLLPSVTLVSLPIWTYRAAMLAWALWLAWTVISWLRRGLAAWLQGGYWRGRRR